MLNQYFVPVTSSNEDVNPGGGASQADRDERSRIYHDFFDRKLGVGDVHVYVVGPDGVSIGGLDIGSALDTEKEIAFLSGVAKHLHLNAGPPPFAPHPQSALPRVEPRAPAIHLVARKLTVGGAWNEFPSENWILLSREEWDQILPSTGAGVNASWTIPHSAAAKLAEWIYPQTEDTRKTNRSSVDVADFRLTMVALVGSLGRARIARNPSLSE